MRIGFARFLSLVRLQLPQAGRSHQRAQLRRRRPAAPLSVLRLEDRTVPTATALVSAGDVTINVKGSPPGSDNLQFVERGSLLDVLDNGNSLLLTSGPALSMVTSITVNDSEGGNSIDFTGLTPAHLPSLVSPNGVVINDTSGPANDIITTPLFAGMSINGGGHDQASFNDQNNASSGVLYTVTATTLTSTQRGSSTRYSGLQDLTLSSGSGGDTVIVSDTHTGTTTNLNGGAGSDTFTIESAASQSVLQINTGGGANVVNVQATKSGSMTTVTGGKNNDVINVGNSANSLLGIQGNLLIDGGGADATPTVAFTVAGQTNTPPVGDTLNLNNQGDTTANLAYTLTAGSVSVSDLPQAILFNNQLTGTTFGTVNLNIASPTSTIDIQGTAASTTTQVTDSAGSDTVTVDNTGANSNLGISTGNGTNAVQVTTTGAGSYTSIQGGTGDDTFTVIGTGQNSRLGLNTGDGANIVNLEGTGTGSTTVVQGGKNNDSFLLGSTSNSLAHLQGGITIDGGGFDATPTVSQTVSGQTITLPSGDSIDFQDQGDTTPNLQYTLAATSLTRTGLPAPINFTNLQTVTLDLGAGGARVDLLGTGASTRTFLNGAANTIGDQFSIKATAAGSLTDVEGTDGNDTFNLDDGAGSMAGLKGIISLDGNGSLATPTQTLSIAVPGSPVSNVLPVGDTIRFNDQSDPAADLQYTLDLTTLTQSGLPNPITFANMQTVNLATGTGNVGIDIKATGDSTTTTVDGTAGTDAITLENSGKSSSVTLESGDGDNSIDIKKTGANSVTGALADEGIHTITLESQGAGSTVGISAGEATIIANVQTTPAGSTTVVAGGTGDDTFSLGGGTASSLANLLGMLVLDGGSGANTLNLNDQGDATTGLVYTLDATTFTRTGLNKAFSLTNFQSINLNTGSAGVTVDVKTTADGTTTTVNGGVGSDTFTLEASGEGSSVNLNTGDGANTVNVQGTGAGSVANVQGGPGSDTFNVGSTAGSLAGLLGTVALVGGGIATSPAIDTANINDAGDATSGLVYTLTASTLDRTGLPSPAISYSQLQVVNLSTGAAGSTINVRGTASGTATNITAGAGNDDIHISSNAGSDDNGTLDGIAGSLAIDAGGGSANRLVVSNFGGTAHPNIVMTSSQILGFAGPSGLTTISYAATSGGYGSILLRGAAGGGDGINLQSTPAGATTQVEDNGFRDTVTLGGTAGLTGLGGPVLVQSAAGAGGVRSTTLVINDTGDPIARSAGLSTPSAGFGMLQGLAPAALMFAYSDLANATALLGSGNNAFTFASAIPLVFNVMGGSGNDVFLFANGASTAGSINGQGGTNTLDLAAYTTLVRVNLATATASPMLGGTFASIQQIIGGQSAGDTLTGPSTGSVSWRITGVDAGSVNGTVSFSSFGNLLGGPGNDTFTFADGARLSGALDGGLAPGNGFDSLEFTGFQAGLQVRLTRLTTDGIAAGTVVNRGSGVPVIGLGFKNFGEVIGGQGDNTLVGATGQPLTWTLTGRNMGAVSISVAANQSANGPLRFRNIHSLTGDSLTNVFAFQNGGSLAGTITGLGAGTKNRGHNFLDLSGIQSSLIIDLRQTSGSVKMAQGGQTVIDGIQGVFSVIGSANGGDTMFGSPLGGVLVAHGGNNTLKATGGNNILIGGFGAHNTVVGSPGNNILIDGKTKFDNNVDALDALFAEWNKTKGNPFLLRIFHIRNGLGLTKGNRLDLTTVTVFTFTPGKTGNLTGPAHGALNWFFPFPAPASAGTGNVSAVHPVHHRRGK